MKKVVYLFSKLSDDHLKQQIDAVVAAAVFDTEPQVWLMGDAANQLNQEFYAERFNALSMLDVPVVDLSNKQYLSIMLSEFDHVVRF